MRYTKYARYLKGMSGPGEENIYLKDKGRYRYADPIITELKKDKIVPYGAITYDFTPNLSAYVSYTSIFKPQEPTYGDGTLTLPPLEGTNYEFGIKSFLWDRFSVNLAFFMIKQENRGIYTTKFTDQAERSVAAAGEVESKGIDFEIAGELIKDFNIFLGYTYNKSEFTKDEKPRTDMFGNPLPKETFDDGSLNFSRHTPEHMLRAYVTYKIPTTNFTIGAGATYQSQTESLYLLKQGGYTVWDANLEYEFNENAKVNLVVNNITDKKYFENNEERSMGQYNFYGKPRTTSLNFSWKF